MAGRVGGVVLCSLHKWREKEESLSHFYLDDSSHLGKSDSPKRFTSQSEASLKEVRNSDKI